MKRILCIIITLTVAFVGCDNNTPEPIIPDTTIASLGTPADNEIWFTTEDNRNLMALNEEAFDVTISDIEYSEFGINAIRFERPLTEIGEEAFYKCRNITNISLPETVTTIGESAFGECTALECMTIGGKISTIGKMAFDNCIALHSLHISSVGEWCNIEFADPVANPIYHCGQFVVNGKKVTEVTVPDWVKEIKPYAFYNYTQMSSIKIPDSITSIGTEAFVGCDALSKVFITDVAKWCEIEFNGEMSNPLSTAGELYINGASATNLSLEGVTTISNWAFIRFSSLQSVVANDIESIGLEAFRGCTALTNVTLGEGIAEINDRTFMGCQALKNISIPNSVTSIGNYAFGYCSSLTSVTIGNSVTSIGNYAFGYCSSLKAFYGKFASTDNRCLIIDGVLHYFAIGCGATEYTIPNSVIEIGTSVFYNCSSLTSITIGDSVTSIGDTAFYNCSSLTNVYCKPITPPTGGYNMFENNASGRKFYVPSESLDTYKSNKSWSRYADSIEALN